MKVFGRDRSLDITILGVDVDSVRPKKIVLFSRDRESRNIPQSSLQAGSILTGAGDLGVHVVVGPGFTSPTGGIVGRPGLGDDVAGKDVGVGFNLGGPETRFVSHGPDDLRSGNADRITVNQPFGGRGC